MENLTEDLNGDNPDENIDDDNGEPDYYYCPCCNYTQTNKPEFGMQCPKCTAPMEEAFL